MAATQNHIKIKKKNCLKLYARGGDLIDILVIRHAGTKFPSNESIASGQRRHKNIVAQQKI